MKFSVKEVAEALGLDAVSGMEESAAGWSAEVSGWSVDSRTLSPGELFFALRGPNQDGHKHLEEAFRKGAAAAVVDRDLDGGVALGGILLRVGDSLDALQTLAARARQRWGGDVVAVTGSAGKTTTKDIIAEMLAEGAKTAKTEGNLNNHVGLPLSLLRLDETARVAVIEMGMNHAGEIQKLAAIARPQVGVVTNVGSAHIENFDSIDGVAAAKRELIESLAPDGIAVLNADDPRVAGFAKAHSGRTVLYGQSPAAEVRAEDVEFSADGIQFSVGSTRFVTQLTGQYNLSNVLAGIAVAGIYGIPPHQLRDRVHGLRPGKMRGERFFHEGVLIYNDCYNSNPDAVRAMLDVLRDTTARRRIAVLGEMLELGARAESLHRDVGSYAAEQGIDVLVGIHGAACHILEAARESGIGGEQVFFFEDASEAGHMIRAIAQPGDAILFKGSRGVHVERALEQFLAPSTQDVEAGGRG